MYSIVQSCTSKVVPSTRRRSTPARIAQSQRFGPGPGTHPDFVSMGKMGVEIRKKSLLRSCHVSSAQIENHCPQLTNYFAQLTQLTFQKTSTLLIFISRFGVVFVTFIGSLSRITQT